jgi:hypothetical protein
MTTARPLLVVIAALSLGACASMTPATDPDDGDIDLVMTPKVFEIVQAEGKVDIANDDRIRCYKEMPLGSHIWRIKCYLKEEVDKDRELAQQKMHDAQTRHRKSRSGG